MTFQRTTTGSLLRSSQAYAAQLCDKETLSGGIAYYCDRFGTLPAVNQFREVLLAESANPSAIVAEVERWFSDRGLTCGRWAPAEHQPVAPLEGALVSHDYTRRDLAALVLTQWREWEPAPEVRVVPARAARAAYRATWLADGMVGSADDLALRADAHNERLDDPQLDAVVALVGGRPAGRCALYQVGDICRVLHFAVLAGHEARGTGGALLGHVLALARRLEMRHVYTQVDRRRTQRIAFFEQAGFVCDGTLVEFCRAGDGDLGDAQ